MVRGTNEEAVERVGKTRNEGEGLRGLNGPGGD